MPAVEEIVVGSWKGFASLAEHSDLGNPLAVTYPFRGQADFGWKLAPTLHRAATNEWRTPLPSVNNLLLLERVLTDRFIAGAANNLPPGTLAASKHLVDWWPIMRHHGVPTRILDWTTSIYVAAYFAASGSPQCDGAIWIVHAHTFDAHTASLSPGGVLPILVDKLLSDPAAPSVLHMFDRKAAKLDRMVVQQGGFMLSQNVGTDLEASLQEMATAHPHPAGETIVAKARLPAKLKPTFMRRLRAMNVTGASLFPGVDGVGKGLDELARLFGEFQQQEPE